MISFDIMSSEYAKPLDSRYDVTASVRVLRIPEDAEYTGNAKTIVLISDELQLPRAKQLAVLMISAAESFLDCIPDHTERIQVMIHPHPEEMAGKLAENGIKVVADTDIDAKLQSMQTFWNERINGIVDEQDKS